MNFLIYSQNKQWHTSVSAIFEDGTEVSKESVTKNDLCPLLLNSKAANTSFSTVLSWSNPSGNPCIKFVTDFSLFHDFLSLSSTHFNNMADLYNCHQRTNGKVQNTSFILIMSENTAVQFRTLHSTFYISQRLFPCLLTRIGLGTLILHPGATLPPVPLLDEPRTELSICHFFPCNISRRLCVLEKKYDLFILRNNLNCPRTSKHISNTDPDNCPL